MLWSARYGVVEWCGEWYGGLVECGELYSEVLGVV